MTKPRAPGTAASRQAWRVRGVTGGGGSVSPGHSELSTWGPPSLCPEAPSSDPALSGPTHPVTLPDGGEHLRSSPSACRPAPRRQHVRLTLMGWLCRDRARVWRLQAHGAGALVAASDPVPQRLWREGRTQAPRPPGPQGGARGSAPWPCGLAPRPRTCWTRARSSRRRGSPPWLCSNCGPRTPPRPPTLHRRVTATSHRHSHHHQ